MVGPDVPGAVGTLMTRLGTLIALHLLDNGGKKHVSVLLTSRAETLLFNQPLAQRRGHAAF